MRGVNGEYSGRSTPVNAASQPKPAQAPHGQAGDPSAGRAASHHPKDKGKQAQGAKRPDNQAGPLAPKGYWMRPNCRSISRRVNRMATGRPCGQYITLWSAQILRAKATISSGPDQSPAFTAARQATEWGSIPDGPARPHAGSRQIYRRFPASAGEYRFPVSPLAPRAPKGCRCQNH